MAMRQIMIDRARSKNRQKRGGDWQRVSLSGEAIQNDRDLVDVLELNDSLVRLEAFDKRKAKIVSQNSS